MRCPYKYKTECKEVDTSGMTKLRECSTCDWSNNGVRESRGTPILAWFIDLFKRDEKNSKKEA